MKDHSVFIIETSNQSIEQQEFPQNVVDPLQDVGETQAEEYYRFNDTIFAEAIEITNNESNGDCTDNVTNEFNFIKKVTVEKRAGKSNRKYHIDVDNSSLMCPQQNCKKYFKTTTLLKAHIRKVHCAVYMFVCEVCGIRFSAEYLLRRHMAVHEKRRVECPVCKKMLSERTSLSVHLRSHANTRAHECNICHRRFLRKSTLNNHIKFVHRKDKELACEQCLERFPTRSLHTRHKCRSKIMNSPPSE